MSEILIVSNYFPPERGAAANRIGRLAGGLSKLGFNVKVVCPLPNYPEGRIFKGYTGKFSTTENFDGITVNRLWISPSKSANPLVRIFSTASFAVTLMFYLLFARLPKTAVVQSPPLLLSFLSVAVLRLRRRKVVLNVSDLWPLAALELGALKNDSFGHNVALFFERFIYKNSNIILGQSTEILKHVETITPGKRLHLYRNYPENCHSEQIAATGKVRIFYAGLLGVAQGVLAAVKNLKRGPGIELHIYGDGAEKDEIVKFIADNPDSGIFYHGMVAQKALSAQISAYDIAFVPLRTRIYGSVPSKIFEYAAQGFPILYCGGGEGGEIVLEHKLGWVCEPGDYNALNNILESISQIPREQIARKKSEVLATAKRHFNVVEQLQSLVKKGVFQ